MMKCKCGRVDETESLSILGSLVILSLRFNKDDISMTTLRISKDDLDLIKRLIPVSTEAQIGRIYENILKKGDPA